MAKHIRKTAQLDQQKLWESWYASGDERLDLSADRAERIAKQTGEDLEITRTKMMSDYWESRNEHWAMANAGSEENEQALLVRNNGLDSTCSVFQRADRILTNLPIEVFLNDVEDKHTPAWNDGKNITFNSNVISAIDEDTIRSLHGLNYHELAHLMFTPRVGTALGK